MMSIEWRVDSQKELTLNSKNQLTLLKFKRKGGHLRNPEKKTGNDSPYYTSGGF
jgi:hypothetical protein